MANPFASVTDVRNFYSRDVRYVLWTCPAKKCSHQVKADPERRSACPDHPSKRMAQKPASPGKRRGK